MIEFDTGNLRALKWTRPVYVVAAGTTDFRKRYPDKRLEELCMMAFRMLLEDNDLKLDTLEAKGRQGPRLPRARPFAERRWKEIEDPRGYIDVKVDGVCTIVKSYLEGPGPIRIGDKVSARFRRASAATHTCLDLYWVLEREPADFSNTTT